jgi:hypothetical protein
MRLLCLISTALMVTGCEVGLTQLEYRPSGREQQALARAAGTFAGRVEHQESERIIEELDLSARKALLVFGASLAYEKNPQLQRGVEEALAGIFMGLGFLFFDLPDTADGLVRVGLERGSQTIALELEKEFGGSAQTLLGTTGGKGTLLEKLSARHTEPAGARLRALLDAGAHTGCRYQGRVVSFELGLLRFTGWNHADLSRTFVDWKRRARSLHLVEVGCADARAFVVLATEDDHPEPRVVFFRFLPAEAFEQAKGRLLRWL